jgi:N-acetylated-alpha-linked acidic dipeptidase
VPGVNCTCSLLLAGLVTLANAHAQPGTPQKTDSQSQSILGFSNGNSAQERSLEKQFDSYLKPEHLDARMKKMSSRPHHVGSKFDKENAEFIASQFREWGYETEIERFDVLFPTPKTRVLELIKPAKFKARLEEPPVKGDATSTLISEMLPPYHAYSADGDVTGELVYVNYGVPKDYEVLEEKGIEVKGRIVIARYGGSWRGIKPKVAAEHGAIGCLIYSDPRDDGYFQGDVYPTGAYRNENGAQRGSVADMPLYAGDPLTPGVGSTKDAKRLSIKEARTIMKIPVLPISYGDALPLLRVLTNGPVAPEEWRGALPITYHVGPGPATVHLHLAFNWDLAPAYDVIAKLPGADRPDEWIIRGNHHDAWVFGADDPLSGTVALMEEARAVSELKKGGWNPKRTIVYTVWDAEEPCLLGSTEWVETHAELLSQKAAVYVNGDNNGRGFLAANGSHTLEKMVNEVARDVIDPEKKISVDARLRAARQIKGTPEEKKEARDRADLRIGALGSGSDYTPFLQHLGIASVDIRYTGEDGGGSYHSSYDSYDHYRRFGDPGFAYGIALAQTSGRVVLRLANADVLPLEFTDFADTIAKYIGEVKKLTTDERERTAEKNRWLKERTLEAVYDPTQPYHLPKPQEPVPSLDFSPLDNALSHLQESARKYQIAVNKTNANEQRPSPETLKNLDAILIKTERVMLTESGLPRRPWYKHQIYAPGFYTGYGVKTLPGVREAIEGRNWTEATEQIKVTAEAIERVVAEIERAVKTVMANE